MQLRNLFLLACLLATSLLSANPILSGEGSHPSFNTTMEESCNLPAPTNFICNAWGQNWVHLMWDLTNPGYPHRIKVYSCKDSSLVKTIIADVGVIETTIFFNNPGGVYFFEIKAMCTSGDSPNSAWISCFSPSGTGYIIDLIVNSFSASGSTPQCSLTAQLGGEKCYFPNAGTASFRVRQSAFPANYKIFGIENTSGPVSTNFKVKVLTVNPSEGGYSFFADLQPPPPPSPGLQLWVSGEECEIKYGGQFIARFITDFDGTQSYIQSVFIMPGFEIIKTSLDGPGKPEGNFADVSSDRFEDLALLNQTASASPNPFNEALDVFTGNLSAESIRMQMYNLSGQKVFDAQLPGGQNKYTLSSTSLSPGFYLLRIEADGQVQTLKVVKSE